jgi:hypothetical protein
MLSCMTKRAAKKVTRHGATQPEGERARKQVLLRLAPETDAELTEFAKSIGAPKSYLVEAAMRLVMRSFASGDPIDTALELPDELTELYDRDGSAGEGTA